METLGERLRMTRRARLMRQADLAKASGVPVITITRWENDVGKGTPRPETVKKIASALNVDPVWLLLGDDAGKSAA